MSWGSAPLCVLVFLLQISAIWTQRLDPVTSVLLSNPETSMIRELGLAKVANANRSECSSTDGNP